MTSTDGFAALEAELRKPAGGHAPETSGGDTHLDAEVVHPIDPSDAGENAAFSIAEFLNSAKHLRSVGDEFEEMARSFKTSCYALAEDYETQANLIHRMNESAREYSKRELAGFEEARERLRNFKLPSIGSAGSQS